MISVAEAIHIIQEQATEVLPAETIQLANAPGRVIAEEVLADSDLPPFNRAQMDGYAVRAADTAIAPVQLRIVGEAAAGNRWPGEVQSGEAVRIMTGAPVPAGADGVQQLEATRTVEDGVVEIIKAILPGQFIVAQGSEVQAGMKALTIGTQINTGMIAVLAAFGYGMVKVVRRPRVAVFATGAELVAISDTPGADQIRDSNTSSLAGYAEQAGAMVERLPIVNDDLLALISVIEESAARADLLIMSGGVSVGAYDFTKEALRTLKAELFFERVRLRPGKPTVFARLASPQRTLVFGLPGNPVSASVTFNLFVRTALRAMQGVANAALVEEPVTLARAVKGTADRISYLPAQLSIDEEGRLVAEPLRWGGSSDFVAFAHATALIVVPAGTGIMEANAKAKIVRLPT